MSVQCRRWSRALALRDLHYADNGTRRCGARMVYCSTADDRNVEASQGLQSPAREDDETTY